MTWKALPRSWAGRLRSVWKGDRADGPGDDFGLGSLHTVCSPHPREAHHGFLQTSLPDAEPKERKGNSGSVKYILVAIKIEAWG